MVKFSVEHPKLITGAMLVVTVALALMIPRVKIDTDPENMLSRDDPVRVFHNRMKDRFSVHDMIVVGVVNEQHQDGVFNPRSLRKIYALTEFAKRLRGDGLRPGEIDTAAILADAGLVESAEEPEAATQTAPQPAAESPALPDMQDDRGPPLPEMGSEPAPEGPPLPQTDQGSQAEGSALPPPPHGRNDATPPEPADGDQQRGDQKGVVLIDLLAPSTVDRIEHRGGTVHFSYLMQKPLPATREEALSVREGALDNPLLNGTVVSSDGQAVAIYLPITHKDVSYTVSQRLKEMIDLLGGPEQYHITGLPVAEDTFGHEMFVQMGISAPLAMLVIFVLMWIFFRKLVLIVSPMIVAMVSVICTMGLLIGLGYTVHIMSSMIPIFIMPIAVLDAIHILSEFFDRYQATRDRRTTMLAVMGSLFVPMLYTSLTSAAGFASLALTPIPPVQVFGVFVAFGIMAAWLLTVTFIPAFVMFIPESRLEGFGVSHADLAPDSALTRGLRRIGRLTYRRGKLILAGTFIVIGIAIYGITQIRINDNPTRWFVPDHPIRVADRVLNSHFAGTYQAYLNVVPRVQAVPVQEAAQMAKNALKDAAAEYAESYPDEPEKDVFQQANALVDRAASEAKHAVEVFTRAESAARRQIEKATGSARYAWQEVAATIEARRLAMEQPFKRPELLRYLDGLAAHLQTSAAGHAGPVVGKCNSVVDIVKKVYKELSGDPQNFRVPDTPGGVADTLQQFGNSHTPDDLWHFVTPDFTEGNMWFQLRSGDNRDMEAVVAQVEQYVAANPPPIPLEHNWFGLTYINVVWQQKMVVGMLQAFLGSFLVVFILMTALFSSALWGLLSMIPLTVTIALIYGLIGIVGKDYDMPVAVLSSLTLGLAVDFAIHFLARSRAIMRKHDSWKEAAEHVFGEPARAISRNAIVVAIGFLPLLAAPLVPYKTVGFFMASILAVAAVATLLILPALVNLLRGKLFKGVSKTRITCNCIACNIVSVAVVVLLALNFHQYFGMGWNTLGIISVVLIPALIITCSFFCHRRACRRLQEQESESESTQSEGE